MYLYLSLVERKVAEFYHNMVKITYFHRFLQIDGVLGHACSVRALFKLCWKSFWHGRPRPIRHAVWVIIHLQKCLRFWRISAVSLDFFAICEEIRKLPSSSRSAEKELWQKKMENRWWEITNVDWGRAKIGWHSNHHFFLPKKTSFETCSLKKRKVVWVCKKIIVHTWFHGSHAFNPFNRLLGSRCSWGQTLIISVHHYTHFPQRGLNLKSCVLPIFLREPLKHL